MIESRAEDSMDIIRMGKSSDMDRKALKLDLKIVALKTSYKFELQRS